jgi:hypothetical protein
MAEELVGVRRDQPATSWHWTKLFSAFRIAIDPKKLLLAAAGIVVMWVGWYLLAVVFYAPRSRTPEWNDYSQVEKDKLEEAFADFKEARSRWNLLYALAGPLPDSPEQGKVPEVEDVANSYAEYKKIRAVYEDIKDKYSRLRERVELVDSDKTLLKYKNLKSGKDQVLEFKTATPQQLEVIRGLAKQLRLGHIKVEGTGASRKVTVAGVPVNLVESADEKNKDKELRDLQAYTAQSMTIEQIRDQIKEMDRTDKEAYGKALALFENSPEVTLYPRYKPVGRLRVAPWFEYRGPNPYLLVTGNVQRASADGSRSSIPWEPGHFFDWLVTAQVPVLIEPLMKFLGPLAYVLRPDAAGWNRVYLFLVILWTLLTWGLFGGAITRMAAVQIARSNERIGMMEALRFAWSRYQSFVSAPLFPLIFIAVLVLLCVIFGLLQVFTGFFGDIFLVVIFTPLVLVFGLLMAGVLVGLLGWPMMHATISTEGSDSFDALSRSYSYVYQSPWHYAWYWLVAVVYGAVLVFFVGLIGSLTVYLGKWGLSQTPFASSIDREPTYLFAYAPTSFGWRDLLLHGSPKNVLTHDVLRSNGVVETEHYYPADKMSWSNYVGAFFAAVWVYLVFLSVVGFGYSYFWSVSTIIYLLMRKQVDDTELDEIHMEEEETEEPYPHTPPAAAPAAPKPAAGGLQMVEAPALRSAVQPESPPAARTAAPPEAPPEPKRPAQTMLAPADNKPEEKPSTAPEAKTDGSSAPSEKPAGEGTS